MKLQGKIALISGASRNIGKQIALTFADEGADIIVLSKSNPDELEEVAAACRDKGRKALAIQGDVSKLAAGQRNGQGGDGNDRRHRYFGEQRRRAAPYTDHRHHR